MNNDGSTQQLSQGTPVNAYFAPDALRVLAGGTPVADISAAAPQEMQQAS